jgi:hypothetical protein
MGMYTELNCAFKLRKDTPEKVIAIIRFMTEEREKPDVVDHSLFSTARWEEMLQCDSYYFEGDTQSTIRFDDCSNRFYVTIRCNLKNYEGEIEKFIEWITPYMEMDPGEFLGYQRHEEVELPTLLFHPNQWRDVALTKPLAPDNGLH